MFLWQLELGEHAASLRVDEELGVGLDGHLDLGEGGGGWRVGGMGGGGVGGGAQGAMIPKLKIFLFLVL